MAREQAEQRRRPKPTALSDRLARAEQQIAQNTLADDDGDLQAPDPAAEMHEEEWDAEFPPDPDPEHLAVSGAQPPPVQTELALSYRPVTEEDEDRLWDWIRADEDKGLRFLGLVPSTSMAMRERLGLFGQDLVAIEEGGVHIGFGGFSPVTETYVNLHLYLTSSVRGRLPEFAPAFIVESQRRYPGCKLTVVASEAAEVRLYASFGFTVMHILTLAPPPVAETV